MKRQIIRMMFCIIGIYLFMPHQGYAQSVTRSAQNKPNQEQIVQEILNEVRQLRAEVQRLRASSYQTQVLIGQLRLQQEQVTRLTREISEVRDRISETKIGQVKMNGRLEETEKKVKVGLIPQSELQRINGELEELNQREQRLAEQESQLSAELDAERVKLITLNKRLEELGQETTGAGGEKRTNKPEK
jgi:chromosome segregation ATPase